MQYFFYFLIAAVLFNTIRHMYSARLQAHGLREEDHAGIARLTERVQRLEDRLVNLESLVVEQEKHADFDRALQG